MTQKEFIDSICHIIEDLRKRKKTSKIDITIDMNCGGIGKAKIYVGQNLEDVIKERKKILPGAS